MSVAAPDYVEPLVAWRVWYAAEGRDEVLLASVFHEVSWPVREPFRAVCRRPRSPLLLRRRPTHDAPFPGCQCGIYASTLERLGGYLGGHFSIHRAYPVIGRVGLWGTVVECERGWRAEIAYPQHLYVPLLGGRRRAARGQAVAEALEAYGVPVELLAGQTPGAVLSELGAVPRAA